MVIILKNGKMEGKLKNQTVKCSAFHVIGEETKYLLLRSNLLSNLLVPNYKFWDFKISIHQSKAEKVVFNTPLSDIEEELKYLKNPLKIKHFTASVMIKG